MKTIGNKFLPNLSSAVYKLLRPFKASIPSFTPFNESQHNLVRSTVGEWKLYYETERSHLFAKGQHPPGALQRL